MIQVSRVKDRLNFCLVLLAIIFLFIPAEMRLQAQQFQPTASNVDPFYLNLFEEAKLAFNKGRFEEAFQDFKIAAFGFLDEPDLLSEAFVYLTISAYNLQRIDQVEYYLKEISRFRLNTRITSSSLPEELKEQFNRIRSAFKNGVSG